MNRIFLFSLLAAALLVPQAARSQAYPSKPIRFIMPYPPGGSSDILARPIAIEMTKNLGQSVLIEYKPGGGSTIGADFIAKSPPDGYTIVIATVGTWAVNPSLYKQMPFDVVKDFAPITQISASPGVLVVHPSVPVRSVKELVALAKAKPGALDYGSSGVGGFGHISGALFCLMTGTQMVHIPYKSSAPSLTDLIAGQIQLSGVANVIERECSHWVCGPPCRFIGFRRTGVMPYPAAGPPIAAG